MTKVTAIGAIKSPYKNMKRNMPPEVFKERQEYILSLFKQGKKKGEIADILGIGYVTLSRIWKLLRIEEAIRNDMQSCFDAGKTMKDVQKEYNRSLPLCYSMAYSKGLVYSKRAKLLTRKDEIMALRAQGKTQPEMAEALNVSIDTLRRAMSELGISTLAKDRIQGMTKKELLALNQKYKSKTKIAEATHMSISTVYRLFKLFNIE